MKKNTTSIFLLTFLFNLHLFSQSIQILPTERGNKGKMYIFWGWNGADYAQSDIHFKGNAYDFTLHNVVAHDRQTPFGIDPYFTIDKISIPQTNFRIGYFINDHYNISLGADHMKYIVDQNQSVKIDGTIKTGSKYDGAYTNSNIVLVEDFLQFQHHNGLNYVNLEIERFDKITDLRRIGLKNIAINLVESIGIGGMYPRTGSTLLNFDRVDDWHWSGFGTAAKFGVNINFFKYFFIQGELKAGYINMPWIKSTNSSADKANQEIVFLQENFVIGALFRIAK